MSHSILLCDYNNWIGHMMDHQLTTGEDRPKTIATAYRLLPSSRKVGSIPAGRSLSSNRHVMCARKQRTLSKQARQCIPIGAVGRGCTRLWSVNLINTVVRFRVWKDRGGGVVGLKLVTQLSQDFLFISQGKMLPELDFFLEDSDSLALTIGSCR